MGIAPDLKWNNSININTYLFNYILKLYTLKNRYLKSTLMKIIIKVKQHHVKNCAYLVKNVKNKLVWYEA